MPKDRAENERKKTKSMFFNAAIEIITTDVGNNVKQALTEDSQQQDFKYLGSWGDKVRDINVRMHGNLCTNSNLYGKAT